MIIIKAPATSANLGPGFDCIGLALSLYNYFEVDLSEQLIIDGVDNEYNNKDNLFVIGFDKVAKILGSNKTCKVKFNEINIPYCRGLGSSDNLFVAGAYSANVLLNGNLSKFDLLNILIKLENHPDNIAPCLFGNLCINMLYDDNKVISKIIKISENIHPTIFIPDYQVKTEDARKILNNNILLNDAVYNISHSLLLVNSFENGDLETLKIAIDDKLHVPFRKKLIKDFDNIYNSYMSYGIVSFTISGSGSTMIAFSNEKDLSKNITTSSNILSYDLDFDKNGVEIL